MIARVNPPPANAPINGRRWPGGTPGNGTTADNAPWIDLANALWHWWELVDGNDLSLVDDGPFSTTMQNSFAVAYSAEDSGHGNNATEDGSAIFNGAASLTGNTVFDGSGMYNTHSAFVRVRLIDKVQDSSIFIYRAVGGQTVFEILYQLSTDRIVLRALGADNTTVEVPAEVLGSPATGVWYSIYAEVAGGLASISIKTGVGTSPVYTETVNGITHTTYPYGHLAEALPTPNKKPIGGGALISTGGFGFFRIGLGSGSQYLTGYVKAVGVFSRPLKALEQGELYRNDYGVIQFWPAGDPSNDISGALAGPSGATFNAGVLSWTPADSTHQIEVYEDEDGTQSYFKLQATIAPGSTSYTPANSSELVSRKVRAIRLRGSPSSMAAYNYDAPALEITTEDGMGILTEQTAEGDPDDGDQITTE